MVILGRTRRVLGESTVLPSSGHIGDLPTAPPEEFNQRLRMRRFLLASLYAVLYLLVVAIFSTQNMVDQATLIWACVMAGALILAFSVVFRSGLNLYFSDAGLTGWQLLAAVFTMLFVLYRSPETRLAFTAFFFVALIFGMLRMNGQRLAKWGSLCIASLAVVIGLRYLGNRNIEMLRLDASLVRLFRRARKKAGARAERGEPRARRRRGDRVARRADRCLQSACGQRRPGRSEAPRRCNQRAAFDLHH
jgi:hypothetical protein